MKLVHAVIAVFVMALSLNAQTAPDSEVLTKLLNDFLDGASRNDPAVHDRFWADDLIYTGSNGRRRGKADVMRDVRSAPAPKPGEPMTTYSAEGIRIQQYGNAAIVAFQLVGTPTSGGKAQTSNFLNSGTFLKRNGKWQVVNWQATRMPSSQDEAEREVRAIEAAFHKAMLAADTDTLERIADEQFVWTHRTGEQVSRRLLTDQLRSGQLRYSKLETMNVAVSIFGDTAVVRGVSPRQRSSSPPSEGSSSDTNPFTVFYTLTFANRGGAWKAVAMHTSRP